MLTGRNKGWVTQLKNRRLGLWDIVGVTGFTYSEVWRVLHPPKQKKKPRRPGARPKGKSRERKAAESREKRRTAIIARMLAQGWDPEVVRNVFGRSK